MAKKSGEEKKSMPVKAASKGAFAEIEERFRELERRFDDIFSGDWGMPARWEFPEWSRLSKMELKVPKVDIVDRDNDILVRADVPGVKKENLDISLTDNTITIKGSTSEEKKEEKGDYFRSETMKGSFTRTMSLPSDVDGEKASTSFRDGVLEVVIPKVEKARRIKVNVT
jgi:HSP20 family protein